MISRLLSAAAGRFAGRKMGGGIKGTLAGAAAPTLLRGMGPWGWALGGGYLGWRWWSGRRKQRADAAAVPPGRKPPE